MSRPFVEDRLARGMQLDGREVMRAYVGDRLAFVKETVIHIVQPTIYVNKQWVRDLITQACGGPPAMDSQLHFIVHPGVQLIVARTEDAFDLSWELWGQERHQSVCQVVLENYGYLLGRGGRGGDAGFDGQVGWHEAGQPGGPAIRSDGVVLHIANYGVIAGGGGGSGASGSYEEERLRKISATGGGGAPYGRGGPICNTHFGRSWGQSASAGYPGRSGEALGGGVRAGGWGEGGGDGFHKPLGSDERFPVPGGAAGAAVMSNAAFQWIHRGDVRGDAPL